jgi:hypothetical protein
MPQLHTTVTVLAEIMQHSHTGMFVDRDAQTDSRSRQSRFLCDRQGELPSREVLPYSSPPSGKRTSVAAITDHSNPFRMDSRSFLFRRDTGF